MPVIVTNRPAKRNHLIWLGLLLTFIGAVSYFTVFAQFPALRDFPWVNLPMVLVGLVFSAIAVYRAFGRSSEYRGKIFSPVAFLLSLAIASLFNFYVFSLSYRLPEASKAPQTMTMAADFSLPDQSGRMIQLSDYRGNKVVLVFYRGYW